MSLCRTIVTDELTFMRGMHLKDDLATGGG